MMNKKILVLAAFAAAPFLTAQEDTKGKPGGEMQMPDPKAPEHEALAAFVGDWQCTMKCEAMPGVAGMEKPQTTTGSERSELVCNGLWLKSVTEGTGPDGKPFHGVWLVGWDPHSKAYTGIWACNQEEPSSTMKGSYDAAKKTWTFTGQSPHGPFRSTLVWNDAGSSTETCYLVAGDGKETKCMEVTRKRGSGATVKDASVSFSKPASKELAMLADGVGTWDATVKSSMPGAPPTIEKGTERVVPLCEGKWYWSDWRGTHNGQPFEGHALTGYDSKEQKFVTYWIDSMSPTHMRTAGTYDEAKKAVVMHGTCVDPEGKPVNVVQTCSQTGDMRQMSMTMKSPSMTHEMQIDYKRAKS